MPWRLFVKVFWTLLAVKSFLIRRERFQWWLLLYFCIWRTVVTRSIAFFRAIYSPQTNQRKPLISKICLVWDVFGEILQTHIVFCFSMSLFLPRSGKLFLHFLFFAGSFFVPWCMVRSLTHPKRSPGPGWPSYHSWCDSPCHSNAFMFLPLALGAHAGFSLFYSFNSFYSHLILIYSHSHCRFLAF